MIDHYDPETPPDPAEWLALTEEQRYTLVERYHRDARIPLPKSARGPHAVFHATVENQLLDDDGVVARETLDRLMSEGLTRHDAVHAIGSVLAAQMYDIMHSEKTEDVDVNARYEAELRELTSAKWRHG